MVYLLHFQAPYRHAQYLGYSEDVDNRIKVHELGRGARLLQVVQEAGIGWILARTWDGGREVERRLKRWKKSPELCRSAGWEGGSDVVLIERQSGSGQRRRCDARCYNGQSRRCECICGGINHGVGLRQALENNREVLGLPPADEAKLEECLGQLMAGVGKKDRTELRRLLKDAAQPRGLSI